MHWHWPTSGVDVSNTVLNYLYCNVDELLWLHDGPEGFSVVAYASAAHDNVIHVCMHTIIIITIDGHFDAV